MHAKLADVTRVERVQRPGLTTFGAGRTITSLGQ
jgi:hypothetical protein